MEQRGRGQEVPRAHPGDTRGVDPLWSQPTSLVVTRQDRETTSITAKGGSGTKRNLLPLLRLSCLSSEGCLQAPRSAPARALVQFLQRRSNSRSVPTVTGSSRGVSISVYLR